MVTADAVDRLVPADPRLVSGISSGFCVPGGRGVMCGLVLFVSCFNAVGDISAETIDAGLDVCDVPLFVED